VSGQFVQYVSRQFVQYVNRQFAKSAVFHGIIVDQLVGWLVS
jgi:hypothetical protein